MDSYRGQWVRPKLVSTLPHEIVDANGTRVPLGYFRSKSAATRERNRRLKLYDKRQRGRLSDPRGWTIRPVEE